MPVSRPARVACARCRRHGRHAWHLRDPQHARRGPEIREAAEERIGAVRNPEPGLASERAVGWDAIQHRGDRFAGRPRDVFRRIRQAPQGSREHAANDRVGLAGRQPTEERLDCRERAALLVVHRRRACTHRLGNLADGVDRFGPHHGRGVGDQGLEGEHVLEPFDAAKRPHRRAPRADVRASESCEYWRQRRRVARAGVFGIEHALEDRQVGCVRRWGTGLGQRGRCQPTREECDEYNAMRCHSEYEGWITTAMILTPPASRLPLSCLRNPRSRD